MKTNRIITILIAIVCFAATAQAYFDPTIGRWANRDPINDPGFHLVAKAPAAFNEDEEKGLYVFVRNNPVSNHDAWGLFLGQNYGLYCGWSRRGPGTPIDQIDAACQRHDNCLATWSKACNPNNFAFCHYQFCYDAKYANCALSPTPAACTRFRTKILSTCPAIVFLVP